jgi:hypothetical protein
MLLKHILYMNKVGKKELLTEDHEFLGKRLADQGGSLFPDCSSGGF